MSNHKAENELPKGFPQGPQNHSQKVPDRYFETLPKRVMDAVSSPAAKHTFSLSTLLQPRYSGSLLALSLLIFAIWTFQPGAADTLPELNNDELIAALSEPGMGMSFDLLLEDLVTEADLAALGEEFSEEEVLDFLLDEDLDLNDFIEEF